MRAQDLPAWTAVGVTQSSLPEIMIEVKLTPVRGGVRPRFSHNNEFPDSEEG
jgi:hypothetical protein